MVVEETSRAKVEDIEEKIKTTIELLQGRLDKYVKRVTPSFNLKKVIAVLHGHRRLDAMVDRARYHMAKRLGKPVYAVTCSRDLEARLARILRVESQEDRQREGSRKLGG